MQRRDFIAGTAAGAALLAGCSGATGSETPTNDTAATATGTPTDTAYTVEMAPVGEVTFESVPETWVANNGSWADMGVALGLEPPKGVWLTSRYHTQYYDEVPGVSVDTSGMVSLYQSGVSKELFYELDADVHVMDPNFLMNRFDGWAQSDVDEIVDRVGPLFGNCIYAQHYPWHDDYRYYTLYEAFGKLAEVFDRTDRYEAFVDIDDEFRSNLAPVVPGQGERPEVAVLWGVGDQPEQYYPYLIGQGTGFEHLRALGVRDALAETNIQDFHGSRGAIDNETLLEVDPEVLMLRGYESKTRAEFEDTVVAYLEDNDTTADLTAVRNGDVYRAGGLYQGPITYMVLTERTAGQLYGFDGDLFDRERVADVVARDL
ncbi:ABC transporter substrate-binding protein [Halosegnis marinus]|uniref:ABC transporter substrate-binding protein n=1 Tax=Halosegnis marinus TaxID=3034023 RepID=A0ABD5ZNQ8_9EURY|nr:ABC transporter substrate-binding protein [Halosegnis sp. DT85]